MTTATETVATTAAEDGERTALYRFFDAADRLLYSGRSLNPTSRAVAHRWGKDWFRDVAAIRMTWYARPEDAAIAEFVSIAIENPAYNVQRPHERGWVPGHGLQAAGLPWTADGERLGASGLGVGLCSCGAMSPELPTNCARKRWHTAHADEVRTELLDRIATGVGLPVPIERRLPAPTAEGLLAA